jgi:hypothetical protein
MQSLKFIILKIVLNYNCINGWEVGQPGRNKTRKQTIQTNRNTARLPDNQKGPKPKSISLAKPKQAEFWQKNKPIIDFLSIIGLLIFDFFYSIQRRLKK